MTDLLSQLKNVRRSGDGWTARCPCHEDRHNSLSICRRDDRWLLKCHAGCTTDDVVKALGLELHDLFADRNKNCPVIPPIRRAHAHTNAISQAKAGKSGKPPVLTVVGSQITLADYARAKELPIEFLTGLGLRDRKRDGKPAISIPYFGNDGQVAANCSTSSRRCLRGGTARQCSLLRAGPPERPGSSLPPNTACGSCGGCP